jgi:hypothetical protein
LSEGLWGGGFGVGRGGIRRRVTTQHLTTVAKPLPSTLQHSIELFDCILLPASVRLLHTDPDLGLRCGLGHIFAGPIVFHVALHQLACGKSGQEGQLPGENPTGHHGGQEPCI